MSVLSISPDLVEAAIEPADLHVGVFQEAGIVLHQAAVDPLRVLGLVIPGRDFLRARRELRVLAGMTPSCFCRAKVSSRYLSQPASNLPLILLAIRLGRVMRAHEWRRSRNT